MYVILFTDNRQGNMGAPMLHHKKVKRSSSNKLTRDTAFIYDSRAAVVEAVKLLESNKDFNYYYCSLNPPHGD
jgi:hypothetical protein